MTSISQYLTEEGRVIEVLHGEVRKSSLEHLKPQPEGEPPSHCDTIELGALIDILCKKPVANLDEMRIRTTKFMQLEELCEFQS